MRCEPRGPSRPNPFRQGSHPTALEHEVAAALHGGHGEDEAAGVIHGVGAGRG
jgi:hypothetical protein